jgi:predicted amidohydrolase YtcJ
VPGFPETAAPTLNTRFAKNEVRLPFSPPPVIRILPTLLCLLGCHAAFAQADTVLLGGKIVTLDAKERVAEALAIRDGKISAIGTSAQIEKLAGPKTEVIRLEGKTVLPGFIESHCHSIGVARDSLHGEYAELHSIDEMQEWIRREAAKTPAGTWIEVPRNEITRLKEHRHPTPAELDSATSDHPVLYTSTTKHVLNTVGWRALGLLDPQSKLPDGEVVRDEAGKPLLIRNGGHVSVHKFFPQQTETHDELLDALKRVHRRYNEVGITTIFERATDRSGFNSFRELHERHELTTRVRATFRFSATTPEQVEKYVANLGLKPGEGDDWVRADHMKITVDGGIHWGTTWLSESYGEKRMNFYRLTDPTYHGEQYYTPAQLRAIFATVNRLGWPMSAHVTGDGGTQAVLDAVADVAKDDPTILQRRFNLIHSYFPTPAIARLARQLGAGVDTQGYLYYRDADILAEIYGKNWAERFIGLAEWVRAGVPVAINSDHMIGLDPDHAMNAFNPALMLWIAVARKTDGGRVWGDQQKLSRLDALRSITLWPAWLSFDEDKLGSLEPGKLADLVVVDRDYLSCPEDDIRAIKPLRTIVDGRTVFRP